MVELIGVFDEFVIQTLRPHGFDRIDTPFVVRDIDTVSGLRTVETCRLVDETGLPMEIEFLSFVGMSICQRA